MVLKLHLSKNDAIVVLVNGAVIIKTVPNPVASAAYAFIYNNSLWWIISCRVRYGCYSSCTVPLLTLAAHWRRSLAIIMHLFVVLLEIVVLDHAKIVTHSAYWSTN